jgi:hypothetical protein
MRLLFLDPQLRKELEDHARLYLQFSGKLVDSHLHHNRSG